MLNWASPSAPPLAPPHGPWWAARRPSRPACAPTRPRLPRPCLWAESGGGPKPELFRPAAKLSFSFILCILIQQFAYKPSGFLPFTFQQAHEFVILHPDPLKKRGGGWGGERTLPFFIKRKQHGFIRLRKNPLNPGPCPRGPSFAASTSRGIFFAHEKVRPGWESNQRPRVGVPSGWARKLAAQP